MFDIVAARAAKKTKSSGGVEGNGGVSLQCRWQLISGVRDHDAGLDAFEAEPAGDSLAKLCDVKGEATAKKLTLPRKLRLEKLDDRTMLAADTVVERSINDWSAAQQDTGLLGERRRRQMRWRGWLLAR